MCRLADSSSSLLGMGWWVHNIHKEMNLRFSKQSGKGCLLGLGGSVETHFINTLQQLRFPAKCFTWYILFTVYSLTNTVYSLTNAVYSLTNTVYSLTNTVYSLTNTVYSLTNTVYSLIKKWRVFALNNWFCDQGQMNVKLKTHNRQKPYNKLDGRWF